VILINPNVELINSYQHSSAEAVHNFFSYPETKDTAKIKVV